MKTLVSIFTGICVMLAVVQWWQIIYRLRIFYHDFHGERYANHVGDDVFFVIHFVNTMLLLAGCYLSWMLRREPKAWRWSVVCVTAANVVAWLAFFYMHATGILVGYMEFMQHCKGQ